jgi:transposase
MRKKYPKSFKFKVALEALKGNKTIAEICQEYSVANSVVHKWKGQLKANGVNAFGNNNDNKNKAVELEKAKLYEEIGRLKVEVDFLKKIVED